MKSDTDIKLYIIDTNYITYLKSNKVLHRVLENKDDCFVRKYIGIVLNINGFKYYVPLSSPKEDKDYIILNGIKTIRKSIVPIIRIISKDINGNDELKGTIKFSSMIPVPDSVITYYDFSKETDNDYRILVEKEYEFIKSNKDTILKNASILYNQKTKENILFKDTKKPGYLESTVDFILAEKMHNTYK